VAEEEAVRQSANAELAQALRHPTRFDIVVSMTTPIRRLSPSEYSRETGKPLNHCGYHFRVLARSGCIKLVDTKQVRGSTQHFFEPATSALAWGKEWEALGPYVRQTLCASVLRSAVEKIGQSIDSGSFEGQPNPHLSFDTMRVDADGWNRIGGLLDRTLKALMKIEEESKRRESDENPLFLATYMMASFESPPVGMSPLCDNPG
jgi:hypothetical protein